MYFASLLCVLLPVTFGALTVPLHHETFYGTGTLYSDKYVAKFGVGNPAQNFNLTLDFYYYSGAIIGTDSTSEDCVEAGRPGFASKSSTTYRQVSTNEKYYTPFYMEGRKCKRTMPQDGSASAVYGTDDFTTCNGQAKSMDIPFYDLSQFKGSWSAFFPSDGVLGLYGTPLPSDHDSAALALAKANGDGIVSLTLANGGDFAGSLTFGGINPNCGDNSEVDPYRNTGSWNARVLSISIGSYENSDDSGMATFQWEWSGLISIPLQKFPDFAAAVGAVPLSIDNTTYVVECDSVSKLPQLTVGLHGKTLTFSPSDYVDTDPENAIGSKCPLLVVGSAADTFLWSFGNRVASKYCISLNYAEQKVGFADLKDGQPAAVC